MREIKFRAWDKTSKEWCNVNVMWCGGVIGFARPEVEKWSNEIELVQYTGLKDKNGVEIYEGDIYRQLWKGHIEQGVIEYSENRFWIKPYEHYLIGEIKLTGEVIGNIYENLELLGKEGKDGS